MHDEPEDVDVHELKTANLEFHSMLQVQLNGRDNEQTKMAQWVQCANRHHSHARANSVASDRTAFHPHLHHRSSRDMRHSDEMLHEIMTQGVSMPLHRTSKLCRVGVWVSRVSMMGIWVAKGVNERQWSWKAAGEWVALDADNGRHVGGDGAYE